LMERGRAATIIHIYCKSNHLGRVGEAFILGGFWKPPRRAVVTHESAVDRRVSHPDRNLQGCPVSVSGMKRLILCISRSWTGEWEKLSPTKATLGIRIRLLPRREIV
jgi:hypothetical protein